MTVNPFKMFWRIVRWAVLLFFASTVLVTLIYRWVPVPLTPLMVIRCMQQMGRGEVPRLKHDWVPLSEISPALPRAVMSSEDQRFMLHNGFDTKSHWLCPAPAIEWRARWRGKHHIAADRQKCLLVAHFFLGAQRF